MNTAELIIAVAAAAVVTWFVLRRERHETTEAPQGVTHAPASAVTVPPAVDDHVRSLVGQHRKIYAIKELRRQTGMSLRDAKEFVDRLAAGQPSRPETIDGELRVRLRQLVSDNHKIYAIKELRDHTGMGLRDAKEFVDRL